MVYKSSAFVACILFVANLCIQQVCGDAIYCSTVDQLRTAMIDVQPGDEIVLEEGTVFQANDGLSGLGAHFSSSVDGTISNRITIRSADPNNRATLRGEDFRHLHVFRLFGSHWTIRDLIITHAQKGITVDQALDVHIIDCEVTGVGMEAIHIRDGSKDALIENCFIHHTGLSSPQYGEGVYIGTDKGRWGDYDEDVSGTVVRGCTIGPNVGAEAFDIKEGTSDTIIEYNVVDATGISGLNYADSFIDLKGSRTIVRYNTFYRNGEDKLKKAVAIVPRGIDKSSSEHTIHDNMFYLDNNPDIYLVKAPKDGFQDIYAFNNIPADGLISDGIFKTCCPAWYTPPSNNTLVCLPPVNSISFDITNTSATLSWTGYATNFTVSYNKELDFAFDQVQQITTVQSPLVVEGLEYNATYKWQVRSNCADSNSDYSAIGTFTTGQSDGGPPPYSDGSVTVYDDVLSDFWDDFSFGLNGVDFGDTNDPKFGSNAIKCDFGSYGGLKLKRSVEVDTSVLKYFRFW